MLVLVEARGTAAEQPLEEEDDKEEREEGGEEGKESRQAWCWDFICLAVP